MSSDSGSDFEGFNQQDVDDAQANVLSDVNESDIEVSEIDSESDSDQSGASDHNSDDGEGADIDWSANTHDVVLNPFQQRTGPNHGLPPEANELDYFFCFWGDDWFDMIAQETNRYAEQRIRASGRADPLWVPTTRNEMRAYFAINIMMGIKQLPRIWCYWSTNPALNCAWVSSVMPQTRFLKLSQYLHLRDNTGMPQHGEENFDRLYKLRPILDELPGRFRDVYRPRCELSVDEGMIGFKGRLSFRQYIPAKPTKWGIKVWQLCESQSAYCLNFEVYTGRVAGVLAPHGLGHRVVMNMMHPYLNRNHHVYFDRFFTSTQLMEDLEEAGTYACATVMLNRRGLPNEARRLKLRRRGETFFRQKENEVLTVWKDKRQVSVLSTNSNATVQERARKPDAVLNYNAHMGGVDKTDQLRSYYKVGRVSKKWWRYIMWYLFDISIVNAWILFQSSPHEPQMRRGYDQLQFRLNLAEHLRAGFTSRKFRKGRRSRDVLGEAFDQENINGHKLVPVDNKRRKAVCRQCSRENRKTPKGYQVETSVKCSVCDVALCRVGCFLEYHG